MSGRRARRARVLGLLVEAAAVVTGTAVPRGAAISSNTFTSTGEVRPGGNAATVGLVLGCEATGTFTVKVTVHQGDAVAVGRRHGRCTGRAETYDVVVTTTDSPTPRTGLAQICGDAALAGRGCFVCEDEDVWDYSDHRPVIAQFAGAPS